jgi:hypothetical protein
MHSPVMGPIIAEGVARTIQTRPTEQWLVVHHKPTGEMDFEKLVRAKLSLDDERVHFLTWGRHDATNRFAHVSNVILAGTLFFPDFLYEALGRLAAARPSSTGQFEEASSVRLGELHHGIIQALCRAAVRGFAHGNCPRTQAYVIANRWTGLPQSLLDVFTRFCTRSRKWGTFVIGRKTIKKRMRAKLLAIKIELRRIMHDPIAKTGAWVKQMLKGHLNYFAVSGNHPSLWWFFNKVKRLWLASLKRRSQTARLSWERFIQFVAGFFPPIRTLHPLPCHRFDARTRGRSPVR